MWRAISRQLKKSEVILSRSFNLGETSGLAPLACQVIAPTSKVSSVAAGFSCTAITSSRKQNSSTRWDILKSEGYNINPCNSKLHPAALDAGIEPESEEEKPVQEAYTPESTCFGCGPAAEDGLHLRSYRVPGGLEAQITLDSKYCAFPGIINGGIISALFDCHGNWTSAISLMDRGCVPNPPLTLTKELLVTYIEPTPPDEPLIVRSQIVNIQEGTDIGQKATVQVDLSLYQTLGGHEKLLVTATGIFKKVGALRAL